MTDYLERLKELRKRLDDPEERERFVNEVLSENQNPSQGEEFDQLVKGIAGAALRAFNDKGRVKAHKHNRLYADQRAREMAPFIREIKQEFGITSPTYIARELNERGIPSAQGNEWNASTVLLLMRRIEKLESGKELDR